MTLFWSEYIVFWCPEIKFEYACCNTVNYMRPDVSSKQLFQVPSKCLLHVALHHICLGSKLY